MFQPKTTILCKEKTFLHVYSISDKAIKGFTCFENPRELFYTYPRSVNLLTGDTP
jgi:hypothetical protein